jgi:hypothetical protein
MSVNVINDNLYGVAKLIEYVTNGGGCFTWDVAVPLIMQLVLYVLPVIWHLHCWHSWE